MPGELPLSQFAKKLNNHVALSADDRRALLDLPHTIRALKASAYIVREGEKPNGCAVLLEGFAFRQKLLRDGARQILSLQIPGDPLDLQHLFLDYADHSVQALTDVTLAIIPRAVLRYLATQRPAIAKAFATNQQVDASILREWLLNVGRRDARQRVAHLLCEVAVRLEGQDLVGQYGYELPMSQEQLGDATGLTAVHVNRTLMALENDGLITRSKRKLTMADWAGLKRTAGFNPLYLHIGQQNAAASA